MPEFTPQSLANLDQNRLRRYRENLDFYNGAHWTGYSRERRLVFNYAKVSVDKVTSYLYQGFNFACDPITEDAIETTRAAERILRQVYDDNNLAQLDYETEVDTAILGDGCYKVIWDPKEKRVKVTAPDVSGIFAWWGDDISRVWRVASKYTLGQDEVQMAYGIRPQKKQVTIVEVWTDKDFELYIDNNLHEKKPNPYGFIPFIIFPNLRQPKQFWGVSDIPPLMESQRELNRAMSQLSRILELSGNPIAVLENIETAEGIQVQPGAVWTLPEDAKAYLLDLLQGGGVRLHIDYIELVYRNLHDLSEAPRAAYGGIERELSGVALEIEMHSLLQKVIRKRTIRTAVYKKRNEMILALVSKFTDVGRGFSLADIRHRIVWGAILPQDRARQAQNEQLLVQAGVHSRRRAMDELGIEDPDQEFERWLEERRRILEMNLEYRARSTRGGPRESTVSRDGAGFARNTRMKGGTKQMVDVTTTTNENPTVDELEVIKAQLEAEIKRQNEFEAMISEKDSTIANLQTEVSRLTQDLEALKGEKDTLTQTVTELQSKLEQSVSKYRDLVVGSNPHLADFIQGASIDEIDTSVEKARALVEKVKQAIEAETKATAVPAGAPARTTVPPEGMTSREKIVYGIAQQRR